MACIAPVPRSPTTMFDEAADWPSESDNFSAPLGRRLVRSRTAMLRQGESIERITRSRTAMLGGRSESIASLAAVDHGYTDADQPIRSRTAMFSYRDDLNCRASTSSERRGLLCETLVCDGTVYTLESFQDWLQKTPAVKIAHIKGFGKGMGDFYLQDAIAELRDFDMIAFDGDAYADTSFTALVPMFLRLSPQKRAVAFKFERSIQKLKDAWSSQEAVLEKLAIVSVDSEKVKLQFQDEVSRLPQSLPTWAVDFFVLGRAAIKATGATHVVCLGGGGISGWEAQASLEGDKVVTWIIFAQSRGRKEEHPTLMDWADQKATSSSSVRLVRGKDPDEADAFAGTF